MYIMGTLLALALVTACDALLEQWDSQVTLRSWPPVLVVAAGVALLYTHYYGVTALLAVNLTFVIWCAVRRRKGTAFPWAAIWRWTLMMLVTAAAFVPWLARTWSTLINWPAVSAPTTLLQLAQDLMVVLPLGITAPEGVFALAIGVLASVLAFTGLLALKRGSHKEDATHASWRPWLLACYLVVPLLAMYLGSLRRPMFNPKFVLLVTPAFHILLAAGAGAIAHVGANSAARRVRLVRQIVAGMVVLLLLAGSAWSLDHLYNDPRYARDDYRGIVAYIRATAGPGAAILINAPSQIETIDYYHDEPPPMYPLARQRPMDVALTLGELETIVRNHDQLYGIFWATADSDPDGVIENWLAENTFETLDRWYGNVRLVVYSVPSGAAPTEIVPVDTVFGESIRLRGYRIVTATPRSGEVLQLALQWETSKSVATRYTVFAQLLDGQQQIVGQNDSEPAGGRQPTDSWVPDQPVTDNRGVLIRPATPAGSYTLLVGLYDGATGLRLPVTLDGSPAGDAVTLTVVTVAGSLD
jgi:mannosyltransferase